MNIKEVASNYLYAFASQAVALAASVATSFLIPKVLGTTQFAYWQLFIFYTSYVGLFALGSIDGLYLIHGGKRRDEVNYSDFKSQYLVSCVMVAILSLLFSIIGSYCMGDSSRSLVLLLTGVYSIVSHMTAALGYMFQAMNETKLYSRSVIIDRGLFLVILLLLIVLRTKTFEIYTFFYIVSKMVSLLFCLYYAKDILHAKCLLLAESVKNVQKSIKVGFGLMLSNIAEMLILGSMRQFIDMKWGIDKFGMVSFSLSIVTFFSTFISQASMVLFPTLRQCSRSEQIATYAALRNMLSIVFPSVYLLYFPFVFLLGIWLPEYQESYTYFSVLLPICIFDSKMSICSSTYFKVLRQERLLLIINSATVVMSAVLSFCSVFLLESIDAALASVVLCIMLRSIVSEHWLNNALEVPADHLVIGEIVLTVIFALSSASLSLPSGLLFTAICYVAFLLLFKGTTVSVFRQVKSVIRSMTR